MKCTCIVSDDFSSECNILLYLVRTILPYTSMINNKTDKAKNAIFLINKAGFYPGFLPTLEKSTEPYGYQCPLCFLGDLQLSPSIRA